MNVILLRLNKYTKQGHNTTLKITECAEVTLFKGTPPPVKLENFLVIKVTKFSN